MSMSATNPNEVDSAGAGARPWGMGRGILVGALAVGILDGLYAVIVWWLRGVGPQRVFQGVAAGLLGRTDAVAGGSATAALGLGLHFLIATVVAALYALAARRLPALLRQPVRWGLLYGVVVYLVMNYVVLPLSAIGAAPRFTLSGFANGVLFHALLVGLPSAFAARWGQLRRP